VRGRRLLITGASILVGFSSCIGAATPLAAATSTIGDDWNQAGHDSGGTNDNPAEATITAANVAQLSTIWSTPAAGATFVESDGLVYQSYSGSNIDPTVFSLQGCGTTTCPPLWSLPTQYANDGTRLYTYITQVSGPTIYAGANWGATASNGQFNNPAYEWLFAFDRNQCASGYCAPLWRAVGTEPASLVDGGMVFSRSGAVDHVQLNAFSAGGCGAATCTPRWSTPPADALYGGPGLVGDGQMVYVVGNPPTPTNDLTLSAFRETGCGTSTCAPAWQRTIGPIEGGLTLSAGRLFYSDSAGYMHAIDAATGAELWRVGVPGNYSQGQFWSKPLVVGSSVVVGSNFVGSSNYVILVYDVATGALRWVGQAGGNIQCQCDTTLGAATAAGGLIYMPFQSAVWVYNVNGCGAATCDPVTTLPLSSDGGGAWQHGSVGPMVARGHLCLDEALFWFTGSGERPGLACMGFSPNRKYVSNVYSDLLRRPADAVGLTYWSTAIDGGQPRYQIAVRFTSSIEYRGEQVQDDYLRFLRRAVDGSLYSGGEQYWIGYIARGGTFEGLEENLVASDEYLVSRGGGTNDGYVTAVYNDLLGRSPDDQGRTYWVGRLDGGESRAVIATAFLTTTEAYQQRVSGWYEASVGGPYMHHPPDTNGLDYWVNLMQGGFRDENVIASLIGSEEYYANANAH
jgi:outer membrane protein assembly factor BamB